MSRSSTMATAELLADEPHGLLLQKTQRLRQLADMAAMLADADPVQRVVLRQVVVEFHQVADEYLQAAWQRIRDGGEE